MNRPEDGPWHKEYGKVWNQQEINLLITLFEKHHTVAQISKQLCRSESGIRAKLVALCKMIEEQNLQLGIVLDFPQLLTAENINPVKFKAEKYLSAINAILPYRTYIKGIHIWGKKKCTTGRWVAHAGNLNTYFNCNDEVKELFLSGIYQICNDDNVRFLVPEVNTGPEDLAAIMCDLCKAF